jgi:hypothetical protein
LKVVENEIFTSYNNFIKNENAMFSILLFYLKVNGTKRWTQTLVYLHLRPTELKDVIIRLTVV